MLAAFFLNVKAGTANIIIKEIFIVSRIENEGDFTPEAKFAKAGENVTLACVLKAEKEGKTIYYSTADRIRLNSGKVPETQIRRWDKRIDGAITIAWYKIEPFMLHQSPPGNDPEVPDFLWYTNAHLPGCPKNRGWIGFDTIEYKETGIKRKQWELDADAHPSERKYDIHQGLGVMRYKVTALLMSPGEKSLTVSSPGKESVDMYGIKNNVHMVDFRKDDTFLGWITSYFNVPGVFGSVRQQLDRYLGVDCADLIIAACNRYSGKNIGYTNVNGLIPMMKKKTRDLYLFSDGTLHVSPEKKAETVELVFGRDVFPGDLIFFDYPVEGHQKYGSWDHVGVILSDSGARGRIDTVLGPGDLILHAGFEELHSTLLESGAFVGEDFPTRVIIGRFEEKH